MTNSPTLPLLEKLLKEQENVISTGLMNKKYNSREEKIIAEREGSRWDLLPLA